MTLFLRFPDETTFRSLLPGFVQEGETGAPLPEGIEAISIIGSLSLDGTYDADGNQLTAPTPIPGFHVNALGTLPALWEQYRITPASPRRVFGS